ncbi:Abhydrolase domain-containing protein C22H12.03 [Leucoagaricus sp. SymC.cos]|nr:Abhydrolase domain-containing protein C22H12.03 [Leucoagaricus sp. SymC.cos]
MPMTYESMAEDILRYIDSRGLSDVALLGHSMGGKVAMTVALSLTALGHKDLLSHLLVSDIAPTRAELLPDFVKYIDAMLEVNALPAGAVKTRSDVDLLLQRHESDLAIRQFLLTNLLLPKPSQSDRKPHFNLPLDVLRRSIPELGSFPYNVNDHIRTRWTGKTLIFRGLRSSYIDDSNKNSFTKFFPDSRMEKLDTGHWVHAEKPNQFKDLVVKFIQP